MVKALQENASVTSDLEIPSSNNDWQPGF